MLDKQPLDSLRFWWTPVNKPRGTACRYCRHSSLHLSSFSSLSCSLPLLSVSHSLSFFIFTFSLDHSSRPIKALKCVVHRCWSLLFSQCDCCCANPRAQDELHHVKLPEATVKPQCLLAAQKRVKVWIQRTLHQHWNVQLQAFANWWFSRHYHLQQNRLINPWSYSSEWPWDLRRQVCNNDYFGINDFINF